MKIFENFKKAWKKTFTFKGRASREEYWSFVLLNAVISILLALMDKNLYLLFSIITIIPSVSVLVRRLHDINFSGLFALLAFVPVVGPIALLVMSLMQGTQGKNKFGYRDEDVLPIFEKTEKEVSNNEKEINF